MATGLKDSFGIPTDVPSFGAVFGGASLPQRPIPSFFKSPVIGGDCSCGCVGDSSSPQNEGSMLSWPKESRILQSGEEINYFRVPQDSERNHTVHTNLGSPDGIILGSVDQPLAALHMQLPSNAIVIHDNGGIVTFGIRDGSNSDFGNPCPPPSRPIYVPISDSGDQVIGWHSDEGFTVPTGSGYSNPFGAGNTPVTAPVEGRGYEFVGCTFVPPGSGGGLSGGGNQGGAAAGHELAKDQDNSKNSKKPCEHLDNKQKELGVYGDDDKSNQANTDAIAAKQGQDNPPNDSLKSGGYGEDQGGTTEWGTFATAYQNYEDTVARKNQASNCDSVGFSEMVNELLQGTKQIVEDYRAEIRGNTIGYSIYTLLVAILDSEANSLPLPGASAGWYNSAMYKDLMTSQHFAWVGVVLGLKTCAQLKCYMAMDNKLKYLQMKAAYLNYLGTHTPGSEGCKGFTIDSLNAQALANQAQKDYDKMLKDPLSWFSTHGC